MDQFAYQVAQDQVDTITADAGNGLFRGAQMRSGTNNVVVGFFDGQHGGMAAAPKARPKFAGHAPFCEQNPKELWEGNGRGVAGTASRRNHAEENWFSKNADIVAKHAENHTPLQLGYFYTPCDKCFCALAMIARRLEFDIEVYAWEPEPGKTTQGFNAIAWEWGSSNAAADRPVGRVRPLIIFKGTAGDEAEPAGRVLLRKWQE
jgi:hypothetical protein